MSETSDQQPSAADKKSVDLFGQVRAVLRLGFVSAFFLAAGAGSLFFLPGPGQDAREGKTAIVTIEPGSPLPLIAGQLESRNLITNRHVFRLGVSLFGHAASLKAGEFRVETGSSMYEIMRHLLEGKTVSHALTIPEGLSNRQVFELLNATPLLSGRITHTPREGTLLPETYHFTRGASRNALIRQMEADMQVLLRALWKTRDPDLPLRSPAEALVMASMVEKETGIAEERPLVASVFVNRLNAGMRLQSDPTIIYGLTQGEPLGRPIRKSEIAKPTPYNTYVISGLPPAPIANPGREALAASLKPARTDYLYFVADGTGGHVFARTLAEHNKNVKNRRRMR